MRPALMFLPHPGALIVPIAGASRLTIPTAISPPLSAVAEQHEAGA
jgi:hypothetical protein